MNLCSILGERIGFFFPISELGVEVEFLAPMWVHMFEEKKASWKCGGQRIWILHKYDEAHRTSLLFPIITFLRKSDLGVAMH